LVQAGANWSTHNAARLSAALSFYAALSLAPLLVISVTIATQVVDSQVVRDSIIHQASDSLGKGTADLLVSVLDHASKPGATVTATILAVLIAFYASSGLFNQLTDSVEYIYDVKRSGHIVRQFLLARIKAAVLLFGFLVLFVAWLSVDSVLGWLSRTNGTFIYWPFISLLTSTGFATLVFALTFRTIPRGRILWSEVWFGAIVTGVGFSVAKFLMSLYFTYSGIAAAYGSAGALLVILLWIYYSSQLLFYGFEVTRVISEQRKSPVTQSSTRI
jgi:membrane protein